MNRRDFTKFLTKSSLAIPLILPGIITVPPSNFLKPATGLPELFPGYPFNSDATKHYHDTINLIDLGELESAPVYRIRLEYYDSVKRELFIRHADTAKIDALTRTKKELNEIRAADALSAAKKLVEDIENYNPYSPG